ncbi:MAG: hypothetical protein DHS20C06_20160 [Hyphobacterium sp.]|nr:MAG: hypothetical protein DHS20C06_20160 [Hyphobacterium sp.]
MRNLPLISLLILSGLVAFVIGLTLLIAPQSLFAGNSAVINAGPDLYSEIRAPGGLLATLGGFVLTSAGITAWRTSGLTVSAALYLSYGLARIWSLIVDGHPGDALILAMAIELALGMAALGALLIPAPAIQMKGVGT